MLNIVIRWKSIIENNTSDLNALVSKIGASGKAEQWDVREFQHMYELRDKIACYTAYHDAMVDALDPDSATFNYNPIPWMKDTLDRDIRDNALSGRRSATHVQALVQMRRDLDMPFAAREAN